jgi:hypothetical protein
MVDADAVILDELGRLSPLDGFEGADWNGVLRRARMTSGDLAPSRRRFRLAIAIAAVALAVIAVAVSPLGAAIGREFGDFSNWLTGSPGKPASKAAQQTFARANARAYAGFPAGTRLRRLITTKADGVTYTLSGFRDAEALCLTLTANGAANASSYSCAPLSDLRKRLQPALVLEVDSPVGTIPGKRVHVGPDTYWLPRALVSFGVVADDVRAVTLRSDDATRQAIVRSDAFVSIALRPKPGSRVRHITAMTRDDKTVTIPFAQASFDQTFGSAPIGTLHGPSHVDRVVRGRSINWLDRHVPRGQPLPRFHGPMLGGTGYRVFGRLLNPDPGSGLKIGLELYRVVHVPAKLRQKPGLWACYFLFALKTQAGSCAPGIRRLFSSAPFSFGSLGFGASDQYLIFSGIASDDVARMRVFLSTGEVNDVPLKDNAYVIRVSRAKFPLRFVAYDDHGRVIGIETMQSPLGGPTGPAYEPAKNGRWRVIDRATRADGKTVALWAVPSQALGWCWKLTEPSGGETGACVPPTKRPTILFEVIPTPSAGTRAVTLLAVGRPIVRVVIRYRSGATAPATPVDGLVLYAPPARRVAAHDSITFVDGYNAAGTRVAHERPLGTR